MLFKKLIAIIYPNRCVICRKKIGENASYTCEICSNIIEYNLKNEAYGYALKDFSDLLISPFLYDGIIRKKILEFKFNNKAYLGKFFGFWLAREIKKKKLYFDYIVPVPMYYKRKLERGYNQSEILAKEISKYFTSKFITNVLYKFKKSKVQSTLKLDERRKNVLGTYLIKNSDKIKGKTILLVDDIYTTGATASECAKMLKTNGARKVIVVTIAHGKFSKEEFFNG